MFCFDTAVFFLFSSVLPQGHRTFTTNLMNIHQQPICRSLSLTLCDGKQLILIIFFYDSRLHWFYLVIIHAHPTCSSKGHIYYPCATA